MCHKFTIILVKCIPEKIKREKLKTTRLQQKNYLCVYVARHPVVFFVFQFRFNFVQPSHQLRVLQSKGKRHSLI